MRWAAVDTDGEVVFTGDVPDGTECSFDHIEYQIVIGDIPRDVSAQTHYFNHDASEFVRIPDRPSMAHEFDYVDRVWKINLGRAESEARSKRSLLLARSDWTQNRDVPEATATAWQPYRQALRDITDQPGFPEVIEWPSPPI